MKTKLLSVGCVIVIGLCSINTGHASGNDPVDVVGDLFFVRPGYFVATVLGSAVFIGALPLAAITGSVKRTANTLVVHPGKATFTRPIGEFSTPKTCQKTVQCCKAGQS
jgi:hypothetical protein